MEKQKTYPLYISKEEEITYKKKLSRNMTLFSLLISGLGILAWPLLLLGGLGVFISLMAWVYYSNVECKEIVRPVLYKESKISDELSEELDNLSLELTGARVGPLSPWEEDD